MNRKYNWKEIQEYYDQGNSWRDIIKKFGCSMSSLTRASKRGDLKSRTKSEAARLECKKNPKTHTEETKKKISQKRIEYLNNNPEMVPYLLNHYSKGDSYPELYFKDLFEKESICLKHHLQIGLYQLDFYNEDKKIDVEIDGDQHYLDKRIFKSDIKRTNYLTKLGWRVYRIRWSEYKKLSYQKKKEIIEEIKEMIN